MPLQHPGSAKYSGAAWHSAHPYVVLFTQEGHEVTSRSLMDRPLKINRLCLRKSCKPLHPDSFVGLSKRHMLYVGEISRFIRRKNVWNPSILFTSLPLRTWLKLKLRVSGGVYEQIGKSIRQYLSSTKESGPKLLVSIRGRGTKKSGWPPLATPPSLTETQLLRPTSTNQSGNKLDFPVSHLEARPQLHL